MVVLAISILTLAIGVIYGYLKPGEEDRGALFKKGLIIGIVFAIILIGLGFLAGEEGLLFISGVFSILIFIGVIVLAVLFIIGTFIGDWLSANKSTRNYFLVATLFFAIIVFGYFMPGYEYDVEVVGDYNVQNVSGNTINIVGNYNEIRVINTNVSEIYITGSNNTIYIPKEANPKIGPVGSFNKIIKY